MVAVGFAAGSSVMNDLLVYPDGALLAGGYAVPLVADQPAGPPQLALARYDFQGRLDPTFGIGGQVFSTPRGLKNALDMAMFDDGSFVVIGSSVSGYSTRANLLVKFTPGGKVDVGFGSSGRVGLPVSASAVKVGAGNMIYVAGQQERDGALASYLPDGRINPDFGTGGIFSTATVFDPDIDATFYFDSMAIDADGGIYVAGSHRDTPVTAGEAELDVRALRVNSAGAHEPSFGGAGGFLSVRRDVLDASQTIAHEAAAAARTAAPRNVAVVTGVAYGGIAIGHDGLPLIVGSTDGGQQAFLSRVTPSGEIDATFGEDGVADLRVRPARFPVANSLQVQPDGSVVFAGVTERSGRNVFSVERLTFDGATDTTYGDQGVMSVPYRKLPGDARTAAIAPDGSLLVGGTVGSVEPGGANDSRRFAVTRLFAEDGPAGQLIPKTLRTSQAGFLFDVIWRDQEGVEALTIDGGDLRLYGNDDVARRAKLTSRIVSLDGKQVIARYRLPAIDGIAFTRADNGTYLVKVLGGQVFDTEGAAATKNTLGTIRIRIA